MKIAVVILAAGQGSRMHSCLPKVLHTVGGKSMLEHVVETGLGILPEDKKNDFFSTLSVSSVCVVVGHGADKVGDVLEPYDVHQVLQSKQEGTGHAVKEAFPLCQNADIVLVIYGDVPLISSETLRKLIEASRGENLAILTAMMADASGYGRIVRDDKHVIQAIVEEKDANFEQKGINEINTGIMAIPGKSLKHWLMKLDNNNAQGEYYLTDIVAMAVSEKTPVKSVQASSPWEIYGVNSREQLARLERHYQRHQAALLMEKGVTLLDPERMDVRGNLCAGSDVVIDINCIFEGNVTLGDNVQVGAGSIIRSSTVGDNVVIEPYSIIDESEIASDCQVGPFARLRPGTQMASEAKVGNFVEVKKSSIGSGSKINHLSYVGDTKIKEKVNIGAGTITCNYDGARKHQTTIGEHAFIGSNTALVAPVTVGAGATIGAGSTITTDVEEGKLVVSRSPQKTVEGWKRPVKNKQD